MAIEQEGADPCNGGFVTGLPPHMMGAAESPDCQNTDPADPWGMTSRAGSARFGTATSTAPAVNSGTSGDLNLSPLTGMAVVRGASLVYTVAPGNGAWTELFSIVVNSLVFGLNGVASIMDVAWLSAPISSVASTNVYPFGVISIDNMTPRIWNQATGSVYAASLATTAAVYSIAEVFGNRVFLAGKRGDWPNAVEHCALNDCTDWSSASNAGKFRVGGAATLDTLTAAKSTRDGLYWFTPNSVYVTTGNSPIDYATELVTSNVGCVSRRGVATDGQGVYFAAADGIYYVNGKNVSRVSDKVRQEYLDIPDKSKIVLVYKGEKLLCFRNSSGTSANDAGLIAAPRRKMETGETQAFWSKWPSQPWGGGNTSASSEIYAVTNASSLQVYRLDTATAASSVPSIPLVYNTPDMDFRWPDAEKKLVRWTTHHKVGTATQTWTYQWFADGVSVGSAATFTIGSVGTHDGINLPPESAINGTYLRLKLSCQQNVTLYGYEAYAEPNVSEDFPRV